MRKGDIDFPRDSGKGCLGTALAPLLVIVAALAAVLASVFS